MAPSGWLISCAIEAVISPATASREACAYSARCCCVASLGREAAAAFEDQQADQAGLQQEHGGGDEQFLAMRLPQRRLPEMHDRVVRNRALVDAPALHLPPVEVECGGHRLR